MEKWGRDFVEVPPQLPLKRNFLTGTSRISESPCGQIPHEREVVGSA